MTGDLALPDPSRRVGDYLPHYLEPGSVLCRIFDSVSARGKYDGLDWNPTCSIGADQGGRFDATPTDRFNYLYGAEAHDGVDVAIWETLFRLMRYDASRNRNVILSAELDRYSLRSFQVEERVMLADLSDAGRASLGVPEEVVTHGDRDLTRRWGCYLRAELPGEVQGLGYNARRDTLRFDMQSFVLWSDRDALPSFVPASGDLSFAERPGRKLVQRVFADHRVLLL